mmetsp:Transcript_19588/g.40405  ORF Transcript_19588/g.40405 Transcript_19588/m.40405 type:complete len:362 (+) Transcript_19588:391-1476(+)
MRGRAAFRPRPRPPLRPPRRRLERRRVRTRPGLRRERNPQGPRPPGRASPVQRPRQRGKRARHERGDGRLAGIRTLSPPSRRGRRLFRRFEGVGIGIEGRGNSPGISQRRERRGREQSPDRGRCGHLPHPAPRPDDRRSIPLSRPPLLPPTRANVPRVPPRPLSRRAPLAPPAAAAPGSHRSLPPPRHFLRLRHRHSRRLSRGPLPPRCETLRIVQMQGYQARGLSMQCRHAVVSETQGERGVEPTEVLGCENSAGCGEEDHRGDSGGQSGGGGADGERTGVHHESGQEGVFGDVGTGSSCQGSAVQAAFGGEDASTIAAAIFLLAGRGNERRRRSGGGRLFFPQHRQRNARGTSPLHHHR